MASRPSRTTRVRPYVGRELKLPAPLRGYQWEGISFLTRSNAALLADEMGLGKTVQAAVALQLTLRLTKFDRALIVVPASLKLNWQRELARWAPNLLVRQVQGNIEERLTLFVLPIQVLIASYEQIRVDAANIDPSVHFDVVILDEAQRIKNAGSATAFASRLLPRTRAWALSGTPVENSPTDLIAIFGFLKLGLLYSGMNRFEIHKHIRRHFLRRRKAEVLGELPPIIVQDLPLQLEGAQKQAYDVLWHSRRDLVQTKGGDISAVNLLAVITRLKQLCNFEPETGESVKLEALLLILESLSQPTDKLIIFSQYVQTLEWLSARLTAFAHALYHGQLSERQRDRALTQFRQRSGPSVLLVSIKAGGVGLNLQEASAVVLFDRWWNPATENQAVQRAHRFGRDRALHVFRFLITNSVEERIAQLLEQKQKLFDEYVERANSAPVKMFSASELRRILDVAEPSNDVLDQE